jgi:hypothetical protein
MQIVAERRLDAPRVAILAEIAVERHDAVDHERRRRRHHEAEPEIGRREGQDDERGYAGGERQRQHRAPERRRERDDRRRQRAAGQHEHQIDAVCQLVAQEEIDLHDAVDHGRVALDRGERRIEGRANGAADADRVAADQHGTIREDRRRHRAVEHVGERHRGHGAARPAPVDRQARG